MANIGPLEILVLLFLVGGFIALLVMMLGRRSDGRSGVQVLDTQPGQAEQPAAGWYPDPEGDAEVRYWDGLRWTSRTALRSEVASD